MQKLLVFDVWGDYAHFKKIYATTSAMSYIIPSKTAIYGFVGAIIGLEKENEAYLTHFASPNECKIAIQILEPVVMQRINTNLRAVLGAMKPTENRKPTTIEYVYKPRYRIYFWHNGDVYTQLKTHLQNHTAVYTPTLGLANLLCNFCLVDECVTQITQNSTADICSVIPKSKFIAFASNVFEQGNKIAELSQYAIEMDTQRNVTQRDDILFDRIAQPIAANVTEYCSLNIENKHCNVVLF